MTRTVEELRTHVEDLAHAFHIELFTTLERARNHGFLKPEQYAEFKRDFPQVPLPLKIACSVMHPEDKVRRGVIAPTLSDEFSYAVLLHELGHHLSPHGQLRRAVGLLPKNWQEITRYESLKLEEEDAAWEWAHRYALVWTPEMDRAQDVGLESHRRGQREIEFISTLATLFGVR